MSIALHMLSSLKASLCPALMKRRFLWRLSCVVLVLAFLLPCPALAKDEMPVIHAGYRTLSSSLPSERLMLHMGVWYPSVRRPGTVTIGDLTFRAARNAPILAGPWPVIVLSHDVTGNAWAHRSIAASLARRGFIVAAPTHDHDHSEDMRMLFSDRELPLRAVQLRAALDMVLEHKHIGPHADAGRVGYLGFGMTAPAGLLLAGADLSSEGWKTFVEERKAASPKGIAVESPWLRPFAAERIDALVASMLHRAEERSEKSGMLVKASESRIRLFKRLADSQEKAHARQLRLSKEEGIPQPPAAIPLLPPLSHDRAVSDSRFRALALISPGYSMLFSRESLAEVQEPVFIAGAGRDDLNIPSEQAERFAAMLPKRPSYLMLPNADMASFHSSGPQSDPARPLGGVYAEKADWGTEHSLLLDALQDFFSKALPR